MERNNRRTGVNIIGDVSWGTHLCQFYQTKEDLIDILVPYFKAGLEDNEFCMWVTSEPLSEKEAKAAIRKAVPNFEQYLKRGQIEVVPSTEWYLKDDAFDPQRVLNAWVDKLNQALTNGYDGIRVTGSPAWLEKRDWRSLTDYEEMVNNVIGKYRMMTICSYSLDRCGASDIIDMVKNHQFALIRREGKWKLIESSEYKQAEEVIKQSQKELETLLDSLPEIVFYKDTHDRLLRCNKGFTIALGMSREEVLGKTTDDLFPKQAENMKRDDREVMKSGQPRIGIIEPYDTPEGTRWAQSSKIPIRGKDDKIIGLIGIATDITELKQAEKALRESEQNFRNSLDSSPLGIRIVTSEGELLYANQAILDIYGYSSVEELKAIPTKKHFTPESYAEHLGRKEKRKLGKPVPAHYEISVVRKDGEVRYLEVFRKDVIWNGQTQIQAIYQDITEHKHAEEEARQLETLKELDRLRSDLLANVSHELRTPLATIKGYSTMLLDYDSRIRRNEKRQYLELIDRASSRLTGLVDNLLDMSRLEAGLLKLEKATASISRLMKEAVADAQIRAPEHRMILKLRKILPRLNIDGRRIRQVLDNLIDNAINYSRQGTEVVVSARRTGRELLISVADQGVGIPAEELLKIFNQMYRVQRKLTSGTRGIGLGLAISKGLVEAHSGRIWAESEEGSGSTFFFTLPLDTREGDSNGEEG